MDSGSKIALASLGSFPINPGDTLISYTIDGDTNLDTAVDVADPGALASNWPASNAVGAG